MTALHEAVLWRRAEMVRFLVRMSGPALINRVDNQGRTPLWLAALAGNLRLVEFLSDSGAVVDQASLCPRSFTPGICQGGIHKSMKANFCSLPPCTNWLLINAIKFTQPSLLGSLLPNHNKSTS